MSRRGDNIHKRKDGRWEGRYISSRDEYGKAKYSSVYGKTYAEVKEKLKTNNPQTIKIPEDLNETLDVTAHNWLNDVKIYRKHSTYIKYANIYNKHIKKYLVNKTTNSITLNDCVTLIKNEYLNNNNINLSKSTIYSIRNVVNQICKFGGISIRVSNKDILALEHPEFSSQPLTIFSMDEQNKIISYLLKDIDNYKLGIFICMFTGLRLGEICALKTSDIDLKNRTLSVNSTAQRIRVENQAHKTELMISEPKTKSSKRVIPICDLLHKVLCEHINSNIFVINGDSAMEPRTYQYYFKKMQLTLEIQPTNFHTLRHTFATNCIENGMDAKCLSEILGHSDVKITLNKYVHPSHEQKLKQINAFAFNYGQNHGQII